ncbi:MAG: hypothetical protein M1366_02740 [Patescibacteria group bacterium]|nr:hypothetical protein [Patescibacteria group bacterium]
MWSALILIVSSVLGFGAGSAGLIQNVNPYGSSPVQTVSYRACYDPQPNIRITLKWPDDFTNLSDNRAKDNPKVWGGANIPPTFATDASCEQIAMNGQAQRTYILVRRNTRIPSCKTDELNGPYGVGECPGWGDALGATAIHHRGTCSIDGYTDLRKIAEIPDPSTGQKDEVFWNPFSYNVGCNYKQDENCGPGDRRNLNLKDFVYVLRSRDAFDPDRLRSGCPVRWDSGATNGEACSHYFDVYMALDLYNAVQSAPATNDPESPYYFIRQVVQNCKEEDVFIPAATANLSIPPEFINTPFYPQNQPITYTTGKIIPNASDEKTNYLTYIWGRGDLINPFKTNLLQTNKESNTTPLNVCSGGSFSSMSIFSLAAGQPTVAPPTIAPLVNCYDPLGSIYFQDDKGAINSFKVYSKPATPQTFYLVKAGDNKTTYVYTLKEETAPSNQRHDTSLQLRVMDMITHNAWTWATPWCKPAIYMYPTKPTDMNVKLDVDGKLTLSKPAYVSNTGWNVKAYSDGTLQPFAADAAAGKPITYPYLYYEADINGISFPKDGWVVKQPDLENKLSEILEETGFNQKEIGDFMSYWLPRLQEKPYYFVGMLPENVINQKEHLTFSTQPDTLIRTRFVFEGMDGPMSIMAPNVPHHDRVGFTVTDWGGTLVGKSCTDVSIK